MKGIGKLRNILVAAFVVIMLMAVLLGCGNSNIDGLSVKKEFRESEFAPKLADVIPESMMGADSDESNKAVQVRSQAYSTSGTSVDIDDLVPLAAATDISLIIENVEKNREYIEKHKKEVLNRMFPTKMSEDNEEVETSKIVKKLDAWHNSGEQKYKYEKTENAEILYAKFKSEHYKLSIYGKESYELFAMTLHNGATELSENTNYRLFHSIYSENRFELLDISKYDNSVHFSHCVYENKNGVKTGQETSWHSFGDGESSRTINSFSGTDSECNMIRTHAFIDNTNKVTSNKQSIYRQKDGLVIEYNNDESSDGHNNNFVAIDARYLDNLDKLYIDVAGYQKQDDMYSMPIELLGVLLKDGTLRQDIYVDVYFEVLFIKHFVNVVMPDGEIRKEYTDFEIKKTGKYNACLYFGVDCEIKDFDIDKAIDDRYAGNILSFKGDASAFNNDFRAAVTEMQAVYNSFSVNLSEDLEALDLSNSLDDYFQASKNYMASVSTGLSD